MAPLKLFAAVAALAIAAPAEANPVSDWRPLIAQASQRFGIPMAWIERVMLAESGGRTHLRGSPIRSRVGAIGLMQLMPGTWADMRARLGLGHDPDDPRDNILAGTFYLRLMHDRFGYPGLFAAYNAGPARYAAYLAGRQRLPSETFGYLASVTGGGTPATPARIVERPATRLFVVRHGADTVPETRIGPTDEDGLFAIRKPGGQW